MKISACHNYASPPRPAPTAEPDWHQAVDQWVRQPVNPTPEANPLVVDIRGSAHLLDGLSGQALWSRAEMTRPIPVPNGPLLNLAGENLEALDPATGELKWSILMGDKITGPYVGHEGELLLIDRLQKPPHFSLRRIDPDTGKTLWSQGVPRLRTWPVAFDDSSAYVTSNTVPSGGTIVRAFDLQTGEERFEFQAQQVDRIQLRDERMLFFSITRRPEGDLWELQQRDRNNGDLEWSYLPVGQLRSVPSWTPDGSRVIMFEAVAGRLETRLIALDAETGEPAWWIQGGLGSKLTYGPDNSIYFYQTEFGDDGVARAQVRRADTATGQLSWTAELQPPPRWMQPTGDGDLLAVSDQGPDASVLRAFDANSGEMKWERPVSDGIFEVVLGPDGQVFCLEGGCRLVELDLRDGRELDEFSTGDTMELTSSNHDRFRLWAVDHDGGVYAWSREGQAPATEPTGSLKRLRRWELDRPLLESSEVGVYLDWDRNGEFSPVNDAVIMKPGEDGPVPLSLAELSDFDADGNGRLEGSELDGLWLWYDSDRDGEISEPDRLGPIIDGTQFDKGRIDLDEETIQLASGARCGGGRGLLQNHPRA